MRTGAIFARGSCRALKWMALVGMVFTLGSGQALAQAPKALSAPFAHYGIDTTGTAAPTQIRVVMDAAMDGNSPEPTAFKLRRGGAVAMTATATSLAADATIFDITFGGTVTAGMELYYDAPSTGNVLQYATGADVPTKVLVAEVLSSVPSIPRVLHQTVHRDQTSVEIDLPPAVGGMPAADTTPATIAADGIAYTLTVTQDGTVIPDLTANPVLAFDSDTTVITVTPGSLTADTTYSVVYTATSANAAPNVFERNFEIEVTTREVPTLIDESGRITKIEVGGAVEKTIGGVDRMHVEEGDIDEVTVTIEWTAAQLRQIWDERPAGTTTPAPVTVMLDMMPVMVPSLAWVSEAETEAGHDDVTIGTGLTVAIPDRPKTDTDRGLYTKSGKTSIAFNHDPDAENEAFKVMVTNVDAFEDRSLAETADVHVIEDDEVQGIMLERVTKGVIYEGGPNQVFEVVADPARVDLDLNVRFDLEDVTGETVRSRDNTIDKAVGTIPVGADGKETVTLTLDGNDANRTDDKIKLHAEVVDYARDTGAYTAVGEKEEEVTVIDVHKLPPTMVDPMTVDVKEGTKTTLTYTVNRNPQVTIAIAGEVRQYTAEPLTLTVMAKDAAMSGDYRIMMPKVTIPKHDGKAPWTQMVEVEVEIEADDDLGMEALMLDATVEGTETMNGPGMRTDPEAMATINIEDATVKLVEARPQAELDAAIKEAGADAELTVDDMVTIMGSALFDSVDGAAVIYSAMSSAASVASVSVSGGEIMVTAKGKGDAMITVEASATMASGVTANPQTEPDRASVDIPIAVALAPLAVELIGPDAGTDLVEGMEYTITAKANRAVEMDTMVELVQTAGTASPADYTVEPITIGAGETMGSTKLMVLEDNTDEHGAGMEESLTLDGRIGAMKTTNSLMFHLWDQAVPALPIIAQILLGGLLAAGGYRRYRRR